MRRTVVYLSGPITLGNKNDNFFMFCEMHRTLAKMGYSVVNPGLSMLAPFDRDMTHDEWMAHDLPIVEKCDAMFRLPGESRGGDIETEHALVYGIPVFYDVEELDAWRSAIWI